MNTKKVSFTSEMTLNEEGATEIVEYLDELILRVSEKEATPTLADSFLLHFVRDHNPAFVSLVPNFWERPTGRGITILQQEEASETPESTSSQEIN